MILAAPSFLWQALMIFCAKRLGMQVHSGGNSSNLNIEWHESLSILNIHHDEIVIQ